MRATSAKVGYGRMLCTRLVRPSQIGPTVLSLAPNEQSSINAPRMLAMPPTLASASARTSMQPPAAAAVDELARATHANGYSIWKK